MITADEGEMEADLAYIPPKPEDFENTPNEDTKNSTDVL
jgi:hypothetical protein